MPRITTQCLGIFVLSFWCLLPFQVSAQQRGNQKNPVRPGAARNLDTSKDELAPPGMILIEKSPFLMATTMKEAEEIEKYLKVGPRQKNRYWQTMILELIEEKRRATVVENYYIDRFEVTNAQYYLFMLSTGAMAPSLPNDHPGTWRGGRLPGSTQLLHLDEIRNWKGILNSIKPWKSGSTPRKPGNRIWELLDSELQEKLNASRKKQSLDEVQKRELVLSINKMLTSKDFYDEKYWMGLKVSREEVTLKAKGIKNLSEYDLTRFNRTNLDKAFPRGAVYPSQPRECIYYPATGISFFQAKACAEWMGKRLPTETEWEKAARGHSDGNNPTRWYPWGSEFGEEHTDCCNWALYWANPKYNKTLKPQNLSPVGSFPKGVSPYGLHDMAGNALEFTADFWKPHKNAAKKKGVNFSPPDNPNYAVIKGGAYGEMFKEHLRIGFRYFAHKSVASEALGFRCAKDFMLGKSALSKITNDLFQSIWDKRIIKLDQDHVACAEKVVYSKEFEGQPTIKHYKWFGFINIMDHLFDTPKKIESISNKTKHKAAKGHVFLGVVHTDVEFTDPPLKRGNYGIVFQKGFKILAKKTGPKETKAKEKEPSGKKSKSKPKKSKKKTPKKSKKKDSKKKGSKKKDKGKKKKEDDKDKKSGDEKNKDEGSAAPKVKEDKVPVFSAVNRLLFVDASGKPIAAIENPTFQLVKNKVETSGLAFNPATDKSPATAVLHLAMRQKYEKKKFLVLDIFLSCKDPAKLSGWKLSR